VQSARVREWQVLPGRTHPVMTGRGGAEGYLFTATRVVPAEGRVEARGKFVRKKGGEVAGKGKVEEKREPDGDGEVEEGSPPKKVKLDVDAEGGIESSSNVNMEEAKMEGI